MCRASPSAARKAADRQQHQPARFHGAHRHLPRRLPRSRPVLSRHVRSRIDRSAERAVVDAVRPRFDRRRDQPGEQDAVAAADSTRSPPRSAPTIVIAPPGDFNDRSSDTSAVPRQRVRARTQLHARRDEQQGLRHRARRCASASARRPRSRCPRCCSTTTTCPTTASRRSTARRRR